ncbi:prolyl oligopeptidase family serine peptidase [Streptomyces gobitricini]|uniref:BD-FAE-like domain-containing protein n=1 Tax=Streptomyces gobitricini TaxID=68211 RepID=A0ABP5Z5E0_9ACTN
MAWGESAGAHLASLLALSRPVRGCVSWYGPTDLTTLPGQSRPGTYDAADPTTREALLLGAAISEAPALARAASPVAHVSAGAPPFLVLHGTDDSLIPLAQGAQFAAALREAGAGSTSGPCRAPTTGGPACRRMPSSGASPTRSSSPARARRAPSGR